jgi:hypothetical protein
VKKKQILIALVALGAGITSCDVRASKTTEQAKVKGLQSLSDQAAGKDMAASGMASGRGRVGNYASESPRPPSAVAPAAYAEQSRATSQLPQMPATGMIIRNGAVTVQVDSLERAIDAVRALATSAGGFLGNVSMQTGEHQVRSATMELKVPAARFDNVMTGMPTFGKVEHSSATAEDVGEEFVDISARVANAKRLESRLVSLLATRTGKLEDVLAVERELARVRQEIERYEGRIRYLNTRVATSTIVATLHEKAPLIAAQPGRNIFTEAFIRAWRNFVHFLAGGIEALGVLAPIGVLAWVGWIVWKRWLRGRLNPAVD